MKKFAICTIMSMSICYGSQPLSTLIAQAEGEVNAATASAVIAAQNEAVDSALKSVGLSSVATYPLAVAITKTAEAGEMKVIEDVEKKIEDKAVVAVEAIPAELKKIIIDMQNDIASLKAKNSQSKCGACVIQ